MSTTSISSHLDLYTNYPVERPLPKGKNPGKSEKESRIEEIWWSVCSFLPKEDLARMAQVSKFHAEVTQIPHLWKELSRMTQKDPFFEDFAPLVEKGNVSWKEAHLYRKFPQFIKESFRYLQTSIDGIRAENPQYAAWQDSKIARFKPITNHGEFSASIFNAFDVKLRKLGENEFTILAGTREEGLNLTHLYFEGDFLFALRENGTVVQWDYKNGNLLQVISSTYSEHLLEILEDEGTFQLRHFSVQDGYLILITSDFCELIPYLDPENRILIADPIPNERYISEVLLKDKKLYILQPYMLVFWDISKKTRIYWDKFFKESLYLENMYIGEDSNLYLYARHFSRHRGICRFDVKTGEWKFSCRIDSSVSHEIDCMMIFNNFLILFGFYKGTNYPPNTYSRQLMAANLNSGEVQTSSIMYRLKYFIPDDDRHEAINQDQEIDLIDIESKRFEILSELIGMVRGQQNEQLVLCDPQQPEPIAVPIPQLQAARPQKSRCIIQ